MTFLVEIDDEGSYTTPLRVRLERLGITHGELSRASRIAESQLSRWFNKETEPNVASIVTIERSIGAVLLRRSRANAEAR
jgi:transcriptional regulator with XRE-family HTH domain